MNTDGFLKDHEKFIAFVLLGSALVTVALTVYLRPLPDSVSNGASLAILNTIVGALTLAFGGSANSLFKISGSEKAEIAQATATAMQPVQAEIVNQPSDPVPTTSAAPAEELPDYAR